MASKHALVLTVATLAAAAPASAGPRDPQERHTKAGEAIARKAVLRLSDFGPGWKRSSHPHRSPRCRGYDPDLSRLTRIGRAQSEFSFSSGGTVLSAVSVYLAAGQAGTAFKLGVNRGLVRCTSTLLLRWFAGAGAQVKLVAARMSAGPHLGERNRRFRLTFRVTARHRTALYQYGVVAFQVDKAIGAVSFQGYGRASYRGELVAARRVASRL
jgi:hypothetical protein